MATDYTKQVLKKRMTPLVTLESVEIEGEQNSFRINIQTAINDLKSFRIPFGSFSNDDTVKDYLSVVPIVIYKTGATTSGNQFSDTELSSIIGNASLSRFDEGQNQTLRVRGSGPSREEVRFKRLNPLSVAAEDGSQNTLFFDPTINTFNNKTYISPLRITQREIRKIGVRDLDSKKALGILLFCDFDIERYVSEVLSTRLDSSLPDAVFSGAVTELGESFVGMNELFDDFQSFTFQKILENNSPASTSVHDYRMSSLFPTDQDEMTFSLFRPNDQFAFSEILTKTSGQEIRSLLDPTKSSLFGSLGHTIDNPRRNLTGCFAFNFRNYVKYQSDFSEITNLLSEGAIDELAKRINVERVEVFKKLGGSLCNDVYRERLVDSDTETISDLTADFSSTKDFLIYGYNDKDFQDTPHDIITYEGTLVIEDNSRQFFLSLVSGVDFYISTLEKIINRAFTYDQRPIGKEGLSNIIQEIFQIQGEFFWNTLISFIKDDLYSIFDIGEESVSFRNIANMLNPELGANSKTYNHILDFMRLIKQNLIDLIDASGVELLGDTQASTSAVTSAPRAFVNKKKTYRGKIFDLDNRKNSNFSIEVVSPLPLGGAEKDPPLEGTPLLNSVSLDDLFTRVLNEARKYYNIEALSDLESIGEFSFINNILQSYTPSFIFNKDKRDPMVNLLQNESLSKWDPFQYSINELIILLDNLGYLTYDQSQRIIESYRLNVPNENDTFQLGLLKIFTEYLANRFNIQTVSFTGTSGEGTESALLSGGGSNSLIRLVDSEFYIGGQQQISQEILELTNLSLLKEIQGYSWNPVLFSEFTTNQHLLELPYIISKCRTAADVLRKIKYIPPSIRSTDPSDRKSLEDFILVTGDVSEGEFFFQTVTDTEFQAALNDLPLQLKSICGFVRNIDSLTFDWFRRSTASGEHEEITIIGEDILLYNVSDILTNFLNYSIFKFNFELLYDIEFFAGFTKNVKGDLEVKGSNWTKLTFENLIALSPSVEKVLCRIRRNNNHKVPAEEYANLDFNIINSLFILNVQNARHEFSSRFSSIASQFIEIPGLEEVQLPTE